MAYNFDLAKQIIAIPGNDSRFEERKMFGGVGYLIRGNMACGVYQNDLIVGVGPELYQKSLAEQNCSVFDITGRPMTGWVRISGDGYN